MPAKSVHIGLVMPIFFRKVHTRENRNQKNELLNRTYFMDGTLAKMAQQI